MRSNLHYLSEVEGEDLTEEGRQALRDAIRSMQCIDSILRQLLGAARLAASAGKPWSATLRDAAEEAARAARARGTRAIVELSPPSAPKPEAEGATSSAGATAPAPADAKGRPRLFLVGGDRDEPTSSHR